MKHCTTDKCPQILDSSCVFYEGPTLIYSGINTNDSVETVIKKLDIKLESIPGINLSNYYTIPEVNNLVKNYIPLSGTLLQFPVIGNIEFSPGDNVELYSNDSSIMMDDGYINVNGNYITISSINNNNSILINNTQVFLNSGTINDRKFINLSQEFNYIPLQSNVDGPGLVGVNYYGNNYVDNSFVQKKFVIDTFNNVDLSNFYTKNETNLLLENYYTKTETYSQTQIDNFVSNLELEIDNKANLSDVYLKTETYNQTEINGFLSNKQNTIGYTPENSANKSDSYTASSSTTYASTKALVDGLATKLDKGAYTGTAQDLKNSIDGKANASHTHNISDVTNLQTALDNINNDINNLEGINYIWSPTNRTLTLYDSDGTQLSQVSLVSLDNEGTDIRYNATTLSLELYNANNELLDSIPVSSFIGSVGTQLQLNSNELQLRDSQGNILSTVSFTVSNIQGLQTALDGKENISNKQNNLNADATNTKYPTVTAVNSGLTTKLDKGTYTGSASDLKSLIDAKISGSGTANYIPKFTASGTIGNSIVYEDINKIGVNTTPSDTLDIKTVSKGSIRFGGANGRTISAYNDTGAVSIVDFSSGATFLGNLYGSNFYDLGTNKQSVRLSATNITFWTNSLQRLTLDINGNIGIGTTSPTEKLEVNGNVKATSFIKSGGTATQILMADGSVNTYGTTSGTVAEGNHTHTFASITSKPTTLSGYGITDAINTSDVVTTATANKILKLDANAKLPTSITGNADGNATTATKLQTARTINGVSFDGSADITINAGTNYTLPTASATVLGGVKIGSGISIDGNGVISANTFTPGTENRLAKFSGSTLTNSIIYDDGTSVGIGSTSPLGKLHVVQNDTSTVAAIIQGGLFGALIGGGSAISNYALSVTNSSSSSLLYVRGDGNVGIGTGSPTEKLEVNGKIKDSQGILKSQRVITITGDITLSEVHNGAILHVTNTCNITIPTGLDANFQCVVYAKGAIIVTFVNGGVMINSPSGLLLKTDKMASLFASASDMFNLLGELATS